MVVVNAAEGEPGSWKDRTLVRRTPHLVLDGALAAAGALRASRVVVAVADAAGESAVRTALAERHDGAVDVHRAAGGFVAGEARALVRAIGGGPPVPPGRRVPAAAGGAAGVRGAPTLLANAETFAQLAVLLRRGPARFREAGLHTEPGTTLLTVTGAVRTPGVLEVPFGTPLRIVLAAAGTVDPRWVVLGGYHGGWLDAAVDPVLSRAGAAAAGARLGAGVVAVLDDTTCALGELARVTHWLADESIRQCGPCRFGLPALAADVDALRSGRDGAPTAARRHADAVTARGACRHPDGTAAFVRSALCVLQDEIARHAAGGGCGRAVRGQLPLPEATP